MKNKKIFLAAIGLILIFSQVSFSQESETFRIIVNKANSFEKIQKTQLSNFFLKKVTRWEGGMKIMPVDLVGNSDIRRDFSKQVHNKSVAVIKAYWQTQIFAGRAVPPPEKQDKQEVLQYVARNKGAIGYVSAETELDISKVKILEIED